MVIFACTYGLTQEVAAEKPAQTTNVQKSLHKKPTKAELKAELKAEEEKKKLTAPIPEPEDPGPTFPADERAKQAEINWDSNGLRVEAANSSLKDILAEITTQTGVTVEGLNTDQRIYGVYGPGRASDVLAQLLEGTGYNILMIGEQGSGTPRQIMLTVRGVHAGKAETQPVNQRSAQPVDDEDFETPEEPQNAQPLRPGFRNPIRTPMPQQEQQGQQPGQPPQTPQPN
jgi:hypothetical protein